MSASNRDITSRVTAAGRRRPLVVTAVAVLLIIVAVAAIAGPILFSLPILLPGVVLAGVSVLLAWGIWRLQNWARTAVILLLGLLLFYYGLTVAFGAAGEIFGGEQVVPASGILSVSFKGLLKVMATGIIPGAIIYILIGLGACFEENAGERAFMDRSVRYILIAAALSAIFIVFLIILFTLAQSWEAIEQIGLKTMLLGTVWRPGSIIGAENAQLGLVPMIFGSILSTFGAAVLGVPLSIGTAILLAEIAPLSVREVVRPVVELLAGIPSVVYGLFGMVVLAPLIRKIEIPYNSGFGLLNASIVLAVMIIPTVTNIAEDAIRAVPKHYKEGSLALGATHWQTIWSVILPASRSGLIAAIILGIGRALGETMALIMVIGNSIAIPKPLTGNPLTLFLSPARTLTGNIAVEINYAAGAHRSALFFTGVLLFLMILLVNSMARYLMKEKLSS
ncbi:MAG: phosphate ABC transporter permease subunit PstC [Chloroflexota bacterium]|nr:phosphate ABC transporter permease subunit PstC [Chloroflexota bacterium]